MKVIQYLSQQVTQAEFAAIVGVSEARVSQMISEQALPSGANVGEWLLAYCFRLREQAAGRMGSEVGGLDLAQERAALARAPHDIKNSVLRGQYAEVSILAEVLATASQAVAQRFDHLPGLVRKACPDLPPQVTDVVMTVLASARNEWVRQTAELVTAAITTVEEDSGQQLEAADDEPRAD